MESTTSNNARICRGCWDQMHMPIPIRGPLALPFRAFGITRSKMNPNICTICERSFRYVKKQRHITSVATILFADIRGFTHLSERMAPIQLSEIVSQILPLRRCQQLSGIGGQLGECFILLQLRQNPLGHAASSCPGTA